LEIVTHSLKPSYTKNQKTQKGYKWQIESI
jgi:hypothetical protein